MAKLKEQIKEVQKEMVLGLVGREDAVNLALLAALSGEHILLVGPPGTAKSEVARRIHKAFTGEYFERLLTKFSVPEELFGPLSIKGLESDRYERKTEGFMPQASVAFVDEIFKANSAILNALLTLLNERKFHNGTEIADAPLVSAIGASNELPESEELGALYDRFLFRMEVSPVSDERFMDLLDVRNAEVKIQHKFDKEQLEGVRREAANVAVPDKVKDLLKSMRNFVRNEKIFVSDRRWKKIFGMLKVAAWCNGNKEVSVWDCWLLQFCLWNKPEEREKIFAHYTELARAGGVFDAGHVTSVIAAKEGDIKKRQEKKEQQMNEKGELLFVGKKLKLSTSSEGPLLYFFPEGTRNLKSTEEIDPNYGYSESRLQHIVNEKGQINVNGYWEDWDKTESGRREKLSPLLQPLRHISRTIDGWVSEMDKILSILNGYRSDVDKDVRSLKETIEGDLWIDSAFADNAVARMQESIKEIEKLIDRAETVKKAYAELPREEEDESADE